MKNYYIFEKGHAIRAFGIISLVFTILSLITAYNSWAMYNMVVPNVFGIPLVLLLVTLGFNRGSNGECKWLFITLCKVR